MRLPWEPEVKETVRAQAKVFESLGCVVEEAEPDFRDANECFLAWRHWAMESRFGDLIATKGDQLNEYVHWHVEEATDILRLRLDTGSERTADRLQGFDQHVATPIPGLSQAPSRHGSAVDDDRRVKPSAAALQPLLE